MFEKVAIELTSIINKHCNEYVYARVSSKIINNITDVDDNSYITLHNNYNCKNIGLIHGGNNKEFQILVFYLVNKNRNYDIEKYGVEKYGVEKYEFSSMESIVSFIKDKLVDKLLILNI